MSRTETASLERELITSLSLSLSWMPAAEQIWQQTSVHVAVTRGSRKILRTLLVAATVNVDARTVRARSECFAQTGAEPGWWFWQQRIWQQRI